MCYKNHVEIIHESIFLMQNDFKIVNVEKPSLVREKVKNALEYWLPLLPKNRSFSILLKPNFNSNFNALTGNTTDMRLLASVIEFLQDYSYSNIIIGEGSSSGFVRDKISVIQRLKADRLAKNYSVKMVDLNFWPQSIPVALENGEFVQVSDLLSKADFIINMPKLKTHYEVGMSVCLKNLIGTCIGRENKKKIHGNLPKNIIHLNEVIKPHLHIIDGLIAMEGDGPSRGTPVNYGKVIIGTDPFFLDYLCARLIGFPRNEVKTLVEARKMGHISNRQTKDWEGISLSEYEYKFERPSINPLVAFVIDPRFQKHLIRMRYAPGINAICSTQLVKNLFYATGISQERILTEEAKLSFKVEGNLCDKCYKCQDYCPMGLELDEIAQNGDKRCIGCLYCYFVCPRQAISLVGELGYYADQIKLYGEIIRKIA